jgi:hypothetical protein
MQNGTLIAARAATTKAEAERRRSKIQPPVGPAEVTNSLRAFRQRTNRFPGSWDCELPRINGIAGRSTIRRLFGSFDAAYHAAFPVDPSDRRVIMQGEVWLYEAKAPYETSGESLRGAIEYDTSSDRMKCHECGEFFRDLGSHIRKHDIKAPDYKFKHGLKSSTALVSDEKRIMLSNASRARMAAEDASGKMRSLALAKRPTPEELRRGQATRIAGIAERRNVTGGCREQILSKILALSETLGRTPMTIDLPANDISIWDLRYHFGSISSAMSIAGLLPNRQGMSPKQRAKRSPAERRQASREQYDKDHPGAAERREGRQRGLSASARYPEDLLIRQMRMFFYNQKRIPRVTDLKRGFFTCSYHVFARHWGSWLSAIEVAFSPKEIEKDKFFARKLRHGRWHPALKQARLPEMQSGS